MFLNFLRAVSLDATIIRKLPKCSTFRNTRKVVACIVTPGVSMSAFKLISTAARSCSSDSTINILSQYTTVETKCGKRLGQFCDYFIVQCHEIVQVKTCVSLTLHFQLMVHDYCLMSLTQVYKRAIRQTKCMMHDKTP